MLDASTVGSGFAIVESDGPLEAAALFTVRSAQGQVVSEAGAPATDAGFIAVGSSATEGPVDTGFAVANPSPDQPAEVRIELRDSLGALLGQTRLSLAPLGHQAVFVSQLFPGAPPDASVRIVSVRPVAALLLRTREGLPVSGLPLASTQR